MKRLTAMNSDNNRVAYAEKDETCPYWVVFSCNPSGIEFSEEVTGNENQIREVLLSYGGSKVVRD